MRADCVVVDANIAFKALVSERGDLRDRLDSAGGILMSPSPCTSTDSYGLTKNN